MKTPEELNTIKNEVETLNKKLTELTEEELSQVSGGVAPFEQHSGSLVCGAAGGIKCQLSGDGFEVLEPGQGNKDEFEFDFLLPGEVDK